MYQYYKNDNSYMSAKKKVSPYPSHADEKYGCTPDRIKYIQSTN